MKTSVRFESAIKRLYNAFHANTLNPDDFKQCAVGNILDNSDRWRHLTDIHGSVKLNYLGMIHQNLDRKFNGYSPIELLQIERAFLKGCGYRLTSKMRLFKPDIINKEVLFNGLTEVVAKLCSLDNMDNAMDCYKLFYPDVKTKKTLELA